MNGSQLKFLDDAEHNESLLSDWERNFIDGLSNASEDYELSKKQNSILNRISQKINRCRKNG